MDFEEEAPASGWSANVAARAGDCISHGQERAPSLAPSLDASTAITSENASGERLPTGAVHPPGSARQVTSDTPERSTSRGSTRQSGGG